MKQFPGAGCGAGVPVILHPGLLRRRQAPHPALRATFSPPSRGEGKMCKLCNSPYANLITRLAPLNGASTRKSLHGELVEP
jgi:hypothetical protein